MIKMSGTFKEFMNGENQLKHKHHINRYEIAEIMSKGCYNKNYENLTIEERKELIKFLSANSPLFR